MKQAGLALPELNMYDLENWTASYIATGNLVADLQRWECFRSGYHVMMLEYVWEEISYWKNTNYMRELAQVMGNFPPTQEYCLRRGGKTVPIFPYIRTPPM